MSRGTQWWLVSAVAAAAGGFAFFAAGRFAPPEAVAVGARAPEFEAKSLADSGLVRRLSDYQGSVLLLNVWATWCVPCQREMPSIEKLYREYAPRGFEVVAVSVDDAGAARSIRQFVEELGLSFEILHDPTGRILRTYQMIGIPESFLIDRRGIIRKKAFETDWYSEENRELVRSLLAERAEQ
jgi:peroxiredoxin